MPMNLRPLISTLVSTRHHIRPACLVRIPGIQHPSTIQLLPRKHFSSPSASAEQTSPSHQPNVKGDANKETLYVLVLSTDPEHQSFMNSLRNTYFPANINKIDAHITLFHALPASKLQTDIIPAIEDVVHNTAPYCVRATRPIKFSTGVGITVADDIEYPKNGNNSRNTTKELHAKLRACWKNFLSKQDSGNPALHYTVMNKVKDQKTRERAFHKLSESFKKGQDLSGARFLYTNDKGDQQSTVQGSGEVVAWKPIGQVLGLTLYEYLMDGHWTNPTEFRFQRTDPS